MDEPTNHLDIEAVEFLESYLSRSRCTLLMVTHDRYFLDNVCDFIIEIDDNVISTCDGTYVLRGNDPADFGKNVMPDAADYNQVAHGEWTSAIDIVPVESTDNVSMNTLNVSLDGRIGKKTKFTWTVYKGGCNDPADIEVYNNQVYATADPKGQTCTQKFPLNGNNVATISNAEYPVEALGLLPASLQVIRAQ